MHTSVTTTFVTLLGPASWESDVGLGRLVNHVICNGSGVFSGVFSFKEKDLGNSTGCVDPIELEKLLEGGLGLTWENQRETPWGGDANH